MENGNKSISFSKIKNSLKSDKSIIKNFLDEAKIPYELENNKPVLYFQTVQVYIERVIQNNFLKRALSHYFLATNNKNYSEHIFVIGDIARKTNKHNICFVAHYIQSDIDNKKYDFSFYYKCRRLFAIDDYNKEFDFIRELAKEGFFKTFEYKSKDFVKMYSLEDYNKVSCRATYKVNIKKVKNWKSKASCEKCIFNDKENLCLSPEDYNRNKLCLRYKLFILFMRRMDICLRNYLNYKLNDRSRAFLDICKSYTKCLKSRDFVDLNYKRIIYIENVSGKKAGLSDFFKYFLIDYQIEKLKNLNNFHINYMQVHYSSIFAPYFFDYLKIIKISILCIDEIDILDRFGLELLIILLRMRFDKLTFLINSQRRDVKDFNYTKELVDKLKRLSIFQSIKIEKSLSE